MWLNFSILPQQIQTDSPLSMDIIIMTLYCALQIIIEKQNRKDSLELSKHI